MDFVNAAPMVLSLGIQDESIMVPAVARQSIPTHLPKIYLYTKKGPTGPQLVSPAGAINMFGADSFDLRKKYSTHQTVLSNVLSSVGNVQMIERVIPPDAGPKANFTLWLDVLKTDLPVYQRNYDGSFVVDVLGQPVPTVPAQTVSGYQVKWVVSTVASGTALTADSDLFGKEAIQAGDQTDGTTVSTRYPILQFWASSAGEYGNNAGFRIWAPTVNSSAAANTKLMNALNAYPFRMAAIRRADANSTPTVVAAMTGATSIEFVLEPDQINPYTDGQCSLGDVFGTAWQKLLNPGYDPVYADLGNLHIYQNNLDQVVQQFFSAEITYVSSNPIASSGLDFSDNSASSRYMFNFLTGQSTNGIAYNTFVINNNDANSILLTESTNLFAASGSDGTLSNEHYNTLVATALNEYADPNSVLQETAINVESIFYDTGFSLDTKRAACSFIAQRKDTNVVLSTFDIDGPEMGEADEAALGAALRTQLQLRPESTYFGTPVVRGTVLGRYGKINGYPWNRKLPITIELALMMAKLAGASNGIWNSKYLFDNAPNNILSLFTDLNVRTAPNPQRNIDWANGLNYPLPFSRDQNFFPAVKTAYSNDTSTLTSFLTANICAELEKVGMNAWRQFSGSTSLTESQLVESVNKYVTDNTKGRFAGLCRIIPNATITSSDEVNGYSWTLPISLYSNNMKTAMTLSIQAFRMSQLPTA